MGLFNKKKTNVFDLLDEPDIEPAVNYNTVLDYLVGLSRYDYDKILKVSGIYRTANKEAARVLGVKDEPSTAIKEQPAPEQVEPSDMLQDPDDELAAAFLTDDEPDFIETPPKAKKSKTVKVTDKND